MKYHVGLGQVVLRHLAVGIAGQVEVVIRLVLNLLDGLFAMGRDHLLDPE